MWIKSLIFFTGGLILAALVIFLFTNQQINSVSTVLPIAPYQFDTGSPFIRVDHDTVVQRNKFSRTLGVSVRVPLNLEDGGTAPLDVVHDFIPNANPMQIEAPGFTHENVNEHYIGRLEIPALGISDGVYYSGDDFYLRRNWRGAASNGGELYIDGRSSGSLFRLDNLINGHNMNSGTKFGKMHNIKNIEGPVYVFINEYITGRTFVYEVFAVRVVKSEDTGVHLNFSSPFVRQQYYQTQVDLGVYPPTPFDPTAPVLTLNTCDNTIRDGHFLVFAVLVSWD